MTKCFQLTAILVLALGASAEKASGAGTKSAVLSDLNRLSNSGVLLSQSLEPLSADSRIRGTVEQYQDQIRRVDSTVARARKLLEQNSPDPRLLKKLEAELRAQRAKLVKLRKTFAASQPRSKVSKASLQGEIANAAAAQETVRNKRQTMTDQFENANQKATQYMNMLSSILKTLGELSNVKIKSWE